MKSALIFAFGAAVAVAAIPAAASNDPIQLNKMAPTASVPAAVNSTAANKATAERPTISNDTDVGVSDTQMLQLFDGLKEIMDEVDEKRKSDAMVLEYFDGLKEILDGVDEKRKSDAKVLELFDALKDILYEVEKNHRLEDLARASAVKQAQASHALEWNPVAHIMQKAGPDTGDEEGTG